MKRQIEIFIEKGCTACEAVLAVVFDAMKNSDAVVLVFEREKHSEEFVERHVVICPATFIDSKLAFYGEFSNKDFNERLSARSS